MRAAVLMVGGLILVSCAAGSTATVVSSTTVPPAPTTTVSATTTTVPIATTVVATTSTTSTTTTTPVLVVEGVPAEALALIGAPMPDVDLTMDSPDDFERWFREYERWNGWLGANPTTDPDVLAVAWVPGGQEEIDWLGGPAHELGLAFVGIGQLDFEKFEYAAEFIDEGFLQVLLWTRGGGLAWALDRERKVIATLDPDPDAPFGVSTMVLELSSDSVWRLRNWSRG